MRFNKFIINYTKITEDFFNLGNTIKIFLNY